MSNQSHPFGIIKLSRSRLRVLKGENEATGKKRTDSGYKDSKIRLCSKKQQRMSSAREELKSDNKMSGYFS